MTIHVPWIWCSSLPCRVHRFLQMGPKSPWVYQVMVIHDWMIWDFGSPPWLRNLHWRFYVPWIPEKYPIDIPWISIGPWNPGCWFGLFFIFHNIWDNPSHWLIFFRGVETTNQNHGVFFWSFGSCSKWEKTSSDTRGVFFRTPRTQGISEEWDDGRLRGIIELSSITFSSRLSWDGNLYMTDHDSTTSCNWPHEPNEWQ